MYYPNRYLANKLARKYKKIAGVDEAGRGALAGPIVAAAVIMPAKKIPGIRDSKLLTSKKRAELAKEIKHQAIAWTIGSVSNKQIDKMGITWANQTAIVQAIKKLKPKAAFILVDGNLNIDSPVLYQSIVKGDSKIYCIAAASILAKVYRDNLLLNLHRRFPQYRFDLHKGYGTKLHIGQIKKLGASPLHRRSFIRAL